MRKFARCVPVQLAALSFSIEALLLLLSAQGDLRLRVPETVGLLLLTSIFYLVSVFWTLRISGKANSPAARRLGMLVVAASLVFRAGVPHHRLAADALALR